ncbi:MAG: PQQ-binding-like beta-propeller repeat protein, partial [bacterium]|nr:PQQ-binding-like beta-propeller repeat protein [bacterium]
MNRLSIAATVILLGASLTLRAENWSRWRGPHNNGMATGSAPLNWSATENIKWTAGIPGRGHSTPVIWGDRIFVTTAVPTEPMPETGAAARRGPGGPGGPGGGMPPEMRERLRELTGGKEMSELTPEERRAVFQKLRGSSGGGPGGPGGRRGGRGAGGGAGAGVGHKLLVMAFDKNTGEKLWEQTPLTFKPHEGYHRQYGSFASNSPVTDGESLYTFFGSRGVYVYDLDGNLQWKKDYGVNMQMVLSFGEGIALTLYGDTLLLVFDHEGDSFISALDKRTGEERWRRDRDETSNWAQPLITEYNGRVEAIVSAPTKVRSYDLATGDLIWECAGLGRNTIPAVVREGDIVYAMSGFRDPNLLAIRLGGKGDLTDSDHVLWTNQRGNSYTSSPVIHDGILYFVTDSGIISALNSKTGEPRYQQQRLPGAYSIKASPVGAGGKLYVATEQGDVVVLKM